MNVLGIDIGAATVDVALSTPAGVRTGKIARGNRAVADEISGAVARFSRQWAVDPSTLAEIRIGSTGAINMLLERQFARIGLITTSGFADTLQLARQNRADLYDPVARSPAPTFLVARNAIHEVDGRLDKSGTEIAPLTLDSVRRAGEALRNQGVEAIAVCLLFSHVNPAHEILCAEILAEVAPGLPVILSHVVDGSAREYERSVSACLAAALSPAQRTNLDRSGHELEQLGFAGRLSYADSRGHLVTPEHSQPSAGRQLMSGPAASALFSAFLARQADAKQALALDIGSTSTDVALIEGGAPVRADHCVVAGVPTRHPTIDIHSVALGGGARATWTDATGVVFSPEAGPGAPTLTDALIVLRCLPPDLAPEAAARIGHLADRAQMAAVDLAAAIRDAALDRITASVVGYAVKRNVDPAAVALFVGGGLGGTLACDLAARLGSDRVFVDDRAAVSGAVGLLLARHMWESWVPLNASLNDLTDAQLGRALDGLDQGEFPAGQMLYQVMIAPNAFMHTVTLTLGAQLPSVESLRAAFADDHGARFGAPSREAGFVFRIGLIHLEETHQLAHSPGSARAPDMSLPAGWQRQDQNGLVCFRRGAAAVGSMRPETLQMRLNAIAQTMQEMLFRTAVSPVVREGNDAAAALLTPEGELLALSDAIPLLLGALDGSARAVLDRFPVASMREGDLYLMNDPFQGGTHLPDLTVLRPVFADGRVIALAASILHHQDVGGMRAGSVPPDAVDIYQEGLRLAPMRMGQDDGIDPQVEALIATNSRVPDTVLGDLTSQIGAAVKAANLLRSLAEETGVDGFLSGARTCLQNGEVLARGAISAMAPGPHLATGQLDPTPGLPEVRIKLRLDCSDGRFRADFTGTSGQVAAPINCVRSGPFAAAFYSLLSAIGETDFRNGGVVRAMELILPEGSAINAAPPAAVNARMGIVRATTSALLHAVASALPETMPAANSGMSFVLAFSGTHADGKRFIATEIIAGGAGGGPVRDGAAGISTDVGNAMNMPAEALESQVPVRLLSARIRPESGGVGRYRGGDGIQRRYLALQDNIQVSLRGDRFRYVPDGLLGGGAPQPAAARVRRADGRIEELAGRSAPVLNQGDELVVESCGGAGYGCAVEVSC